jgi:hypothetical protein
MHGAPPERAMRPRRTLFFCAGGVIVDGWGEFARRIEEVLWDGFGRKGSEEMKVVRYVR